MGGQPLNCPVCCNTTFNSKQSLLEHLTNALENVYCPVCNYKCPSLHHLVEHLAQDNCQSSNNVHTIIFERQSDEDNIKNSSIIGNSEIKVYQSEINPNAGSHFTTEQNYVANQVALNDANKMYVELFSKQLKPCLQTREFKLVKENGESRYMIVTQDDTDLNAGSTIVTKQNVDGTISLTTVKDINLGSENLITPDNIPDNQEENQEDCQEEIYSCNTCKVSFSSVIEHIQNYHNDQDVVVEEPMEEGQTESVPEYEPMENEDTLVTTDKQTPRRVITDTGDIVEEPLMFKSSDQMISSDPLSMNQRQEPNKVEEKGLRVVNKRFLQVDKLCDSVIKDAIQADAKDKSGPYHKVIVKEVPTDNGFAIKMYQCLACDISVTNLDDFKVHPCKVLKYPCLYCPVAYENSKSLCAHMKAHKVKTESIVTGPVSYECAVCSTVFPTNKSLKLHKRMHDPVKSRPIEPPVENTDGSEVSEGRYRCTYCNKMIPIDYKTIHQNSHKTSEKMNCGICNKKFTSIEYLEMHTNVHNVDKAPMNHQDKNLPYSCLYCNRRFARPHEKVKHERIHTGEKPHSCEICGKSFRVSYCLTLHMRTHTGARPYACPHCGKRFKAHSVYNHHLLTHSEVRAYKCPFCPKAFKTSVQLAGHKNSHTKPFSCQHCNRPFASLYAVRVHTETHARQNNLKFSCELCGASYARAFALKDHIKQAHNEQKQEQSIPGDEDWLTKDNPDTDGIPVLNKDLAHEIDLGMTANELIVP